MNNISLGRYVPYNSFIHRMDPRSKILCLVLLMVAVFLKTPIYVSCILAALIFVLLMFARVSVLDVLKSLRVLWLFVIIILLINILIPGNNIDKTNVAFNIGTLPIYWDSILQSIRVILRIFLMIELTMMLTATTKPLDLTYALEWYMSPLKAIKFPAHEVAMVISIALRFIPTLLDETTRIMKAQESRGVDFKHGKLSSRLKAIVSLIIPLFISAFQRSEELADSMEARGYDPRATRTRYRVLKFHLVDALGSLVVVLIFAGTICLSVIG